MEIYNFYQAIKMNMSLTDNMTIIIVSAVITVALMVALFILQGIGIYVMAKKQGLKKRVLAFVPFVNIWYIGKLAGECHFFGQRMKRAGMYAMIAQILFAVVSILTIAAEQYLWMNYGAPQMAAEYQYYYWTGLSGFALHVSRFFDISGYILPIFQLLFEIFLVVIMMGLCKKYAPKNYMMLGMLVLFVPISRFIIIFVLRKRQPIDYEAYMRARHEAFTIDKILMAILTVIHTLILMARKIRLMAVVRRGNKRRNLPTRLKNFLRGIRVKMLENRLRKCAAVRMICLVDAF